MTPSSCTLYGKGDHTMPEISKKYVPAHANDTNPNPKLLKFVRKVTDRALGKIKGISTQDPEYWGFVSSRTSLIRK